ncbi:major facilitator superfamily domain-containing protein [Scheffersomyces xylosifermentans]|uniref:major facilitator superfamily domain-containing protein n=1 Tax=Scheffersomyces xylosifermentans TaxID=1304137 RepID=UPI00315D3878
MYKFVRDSFLGRIVYHLSKHKYFSHKEEKSDYVIPEKYLEAPKLLEFNKEAIDELDEPSDSSSSSFVSSGTFVIENSEQIIVTWDSDDDPENPQNWPIYQKVILIIEITFLTTSVYIGSAVYTPGVEEIKESFGIGQVVATLPLTLFVVGYGIGPMIFSPMSENAAFGRTSIYITTLFLFFILQIPSALVDNIAGLCILRFLGGIFASPALATGGASVCEILSIPFGPVGIAAWNMGVVCGLSLGPLVGSVLTDEGGWRWPFWFMAIISGFSLITLSWLLPETYEKTLLTRKAKRLRALTGNSNIVSHGEIESASLTLRELTVETLWRPVEIIIFEPVVNKKFTLVEMGTAYVSIIAGIIIACSVYVPILIAGQEVQPEVFTRITIVGSLLMPPGLFIFGWTASEDLPFIAPLIGAAIFASGMSFPKNVASVFAGNGLFRSVIAGCFPLFGNPLFDNLATGRFPVAWGSSILGFICVGMMAIPVFFYTYGPNLRARSRYSK